MKHISIDINRIFGEKSDDTVYSLWLGSNKVFTTDDLIFKSKSWIEMKDFIMDNEIEDELADKYYYISQSMSEKEIEEYLHPSKERLEEIDAEYRAWAD